MEERGFTYEDEELEEIDYFEIVSYDEIIKLNPTFVAFSNEELYNYFFSFFKSKTKAENFLSLFNDVIERKKNPVNINNFIIIADAKRDDYQKLDIDEFISKVKSNNKEQIKFAFKNKNKLWFPLIYDADSPNIRFSASSTSILELNDKDSYIIFKDDERDIPVLAVYFYEPLTTPKSALNEKICQYLIKDRFKGNELLAKDFKSFEELIKSYKLKLPLDKIDTDEFHFSNLNSLLHKYNYDLDNIDLETFGILKKHLEEIKTEEVKIVHNKPKIEPLNFTNNRYLFYRTIYSFVKLLTITNKSMNEILGRIKTFNDEKEVVSPVLQDIEQLIMNINEANYNEILNNLRNIRKNLSIDNYLKLFSSTFDVKEIDIHLQLIAKKFELITKSYKDIFHYSFVFKDEEHEIQIGLDTKDYEGIPVVIDEFKKDTFYIKEEDDGEIEEIEEIEDLNFFKKYYHNSRYNLEKGFIEGLKKICPFLKIMMEVSKLPIDFDIIIENLFKNFSGKIPEKISIVRDKYNGKYDEDYYKEQVKKSDYFVFNSQDEDDELFEAYKEHSNIIIEMIYDVICKWSIEVQNEIINETLLFDRSRCYIPCINDVWNDYGMPYDMNTKEKDGVLPYLICIFEELFKQKFTDNQEDYLPFPSDFKKKIVEMIKEKYGNDLKRFERTERKQKKENRGLEAQKRLNKFISKEAKEKNTTEYQDFKAKGDKFFDNFIEALIYMPSVKYEKIHKYLLGCCLEKIDENFSADVFLKTKRKDLDKAKSAFITERVLNKKRYERFYLFKKLLKEKRDGFKGISYENEPYFIYESSLEEWFANMSDKTIIDKKVKDEIQKKMRDVYNIHLEFLTKFFGIKRELPEDYNFDNYKQILTTVSTVLYQHLKEEAIGFIREINETIKELDNISSIINNDNNIYIYQIRAIISIRAMCLPSYPDISSNAKLIPKIVIDKEVNKKIIADISSKVFKILFENKMPTIEDQINYINKIREENKEKVLANLNKKTREEKDMIKEMKKIGLGIEEFEDENPNVIQEKPEDNAEGEFDVGQEDGYEDDGLDVDDHGFIYSRYSSRNFED
jgi:hypothetical protein